MKVLVCGDRQWSKWEPIWRTLRQLGPLTEIVHGDARGADKMAGYVARQLGYRVHKHSAQWGFFGDAAGPRQNQEMLDEHPDIELVIAFHNDLSSSVGTKDIGRTRSARWHSRQPGICR